MSFRLLIDYISRNSMIILGQIGIAFSFGLILLTADAGHRTTFAAFMCLFPIWISMVQVNEYGQKSPFHVKLSLPISKNTLAVSLFFEKVILPVVIIVVGLLLAFLYTKARNRGYVNIDIIFYLPLIAVFYSSAAFVFSTLAKRYIHLNQFTFIFQKIIEYSAMFLFVFSAYLFIRFFIHINFYILFVVIFLAMFLVNMKFTQYLTELRTNEISKYKKQTNLNLTPVVEQVMINPYYLSILKCYLILVGLPLGINVIAILFMWLSTGTIFENSAQLYMVYYNAFHFAILIVFLMGEPVTYLKSLKIFSTLPKSKKRIRNSILLLPLIVSFPYILFLCIWFIFDPSRYFNYHDLGVNEFTFIKIFLEIILSVFYLPSIFYLMTTFQLRFSFNLSRVYTVLVVIVLPNVLQIFFQSIFRDIFSMMVFLSLFHLFILYACVSSIYKFFDQGNRMPVT